MVGGFFYVSLWVANELIIKIKHDMKNFVQELMWRGMIQDIMPGTEEKLMEPGVHPNSCPLSR